MSKTCRDLIPENTVDPEVFADMDDFDLVNNPTSFAKSLRFQFPKFSKGFSSSDFEEFVQEHVGVENLKSLGRLNFPNEWQMEVESKEIREKLIRWGKTKIKNRSCWISPLCTSEIRGFVHWLPNNVNNQKVKELLSEYGEVLFVENQKQSLWSGKVNSDSRYYALYLRAGKSKEDLPHFTKINNFNVLVTVRGRTAACFHCRESGHRKNECKKFKERLNSYCGRPAKGNRRKPRGRRYAAVIKEPEDATKVPETQTDKTSIADSGAKHKTIDVKVPETQTDKTAVASSGTKHKTTVGKVSTDKKEQKTSANSEVLAAKKTTDAKVSSNKKESKTPANPEVLAAVEELSQLKLKMTELFSEHFSNLENKLAKNLVPPENAAPEATGEVERKKKKKKKNKKNEAKQSES